MRGGGGVQHKLKDGKLMTRNVSGRWRRHVWLTLTVRQWISERLYSKTKQEYVSFCRITLHTISMTVILRSSAVLWILVFLAGDIAQTEGQRASDKNREQARNVSRRWRQHVWLTLLVRQWIMIEIGCIQRENKSTCPFVALINTQKLRL